MCSSALVIDCVLTIKQTINIHCERDNKRGVVNNQNLDWSFKLDGILHNSSQEQLHDSVTTGIVSSALEGYNGETNFPDVVTDKTDKVVEE